MIKLDILISCIMLLYTEDTIGSDEGSSKDLIKNILGFNKRKSILLGGIDTQLDLFDLVKNLANSNIPCNKETLLVEIITALRDDTNLINMFKKWFNEEKTIEEKKKLIVSLRMKISKYYKEMSIVKLINEASYILSNDKLDNETITEYGEKLLVKLETYCNNIKIEDPGLVDLVVLSNKDDLDKINRKIKTDNQEGGILKTGWRLINKMTQGGFRKGESVVLCALQHNYKSGFTQSLVMQLARFNKPLMQDKSKKPAIVYISLEDEVKNVIQYMYKYLYYNENKRLPDKTDDDISLLTTEQLQEYVIKRLGVNGYELIIIRGDPGLWTIKDLFSRIINLEANGYEIHACFVDYLAKLPTTFCDTTGPTGTAMRDMFNKCRNFFSAKNILFFTPHQLSTEAKQLMRNGVPATQFVKEVANKGYTEMTKQIDQVVDMELYINIAKLEDKSYGLTVQRGKHRGVGIIDDEDKYCILKFPHKCPIPEDVNDENYEEVTIGNENVFEI